MPAPYQAVTRPAEAVQTGLQAVSELIGVTGRLPLASQHVARLLRLGQRLADRRVWMLLVTGGAGFIGSNFIASLNEAGRSDIVVNDMLGADAKWRNLGKRKFADVVQPAELFRWLEGRKL